MARCSENTKGGKRCKASAIVGSKQCIFHATQQSARRMDRMYGKAMRKYRNRR